MSVDFEHLLQLRLVVARFGEMDRAKWWNTKQLGHFGAMALARGMPRSHEFAQARSVFAVARARCAAHFSLAGTITLWDLPADVEDEFDSCWAGWLSEPGRWRPVFSRVESDDENDLIRAIVNAGLAESAIEARALGLAPNETMTGVDLGKIDLSDRRQMALLAAAFAIGRQGELVVPFGRAGGG